jgi:hypothetical protein
MIRANNLLVAKTTANITISPFSQALFQVAPITTVQPGNYMIEGSLQPPTDKLSIGRTLVNPAQAKLCCCALNITSKPLKFRAGTPMGVLSAVKNCKPFKPEPPPDQGTLPSTAEMKVALEQNGINLTDTIMKGADHDRLVELLYRNIDLYATCLKDLVGSDLIEYDMEIEPGHPLIKQRPYRFAKSERDDIERQIEELKDAGILEQSTSVWRSPIFIVENKGIFDLKPKPRLVFDCRAINKKRSHYSIG